jgi:hypothetical protein
VGNPFDIQYKAFKRGVDYVGPDIIVWGIYPPHIVTMMPGEWSKNIPGNRILFSPESYFSKTIMRLLPFHRVGDSSLIKLLFKLKNVKEILFDGTDLVLHLDGYQTKEIILFDKNLAVTAYTDSESINRSLAKDRDVVMRQIQGYFESAKFIADTKKFKVLFVIIPSRLSLRLRDGDVSIPEYKNI